jgi:hypothetical protein
MNRCVLFALLLGIISGCAKLADSPGAPLPSTACLSGEAANYAGEYTPREDQLPVGAAGAFADARFWESADASERGVIFVSGVDGGFIEPVDGIYARIAGRLLSQGNSSIFVKYRFPGDLETSVEDAIGAVDYLRGRGVRRVALVGWSFGGAVIIQTAVRVPEVVTVIGFAPQARFTEPVSEFASQSLLLVHSYDDENVPFESSQMILEEAPDGVRKKLHAVSGADHRLDGTGAEIEPIVLEWLDTEFPHICE